MSTTRVISIYSSRGEKASKIETDVTTWGALRKLIKEKGYEVDKLHASENVNKTTLEHVDAVLPEGNFTVFMRPKQTKSGAGKRSKGVDLKGLKAIVKEDTVSSDNGKAYYSGYSSMKLDELAGLVDKFKPKTAKASAPVKKTATVAKKTTTVSKTSTVKAKSEPKTKAEPKNKVSKNSSSETVESESDMVKRLGKEAREFERGL